MNIWYSHFTHRSKKNIEMRLEKIRKISKNVNQNASTFSKPPCSYSIYPKCNCLVSIFVKCFPSQSCSSFILECRPSCLQTKKFDHLLHLQMMHHSIETASLSNTPNTNYRFLIASDRPMPVGGLRGRIALLGRLQPLGRSLLTENPEQFLRHRCGLTPTPSFKGQKSRVPWVYASQGFF